jgi:hypothetical protein
MSKEKTAAGAEVTEMKKEQWLLSFSSLCSLRPLRFKPLPSYFPVWALLPVSLGLPPPS